MPHYLDLAETAEKLRSLKRVICTAHVSPDPDAVGSSVGLARLLRKLGCEATVVLQDPVPRTMQTIVADDVVLNEVPNEKFEALVALDTASERRLGRVAPQLRSACETVINIDHHVSNSGWGDFNCIVDTACATAEMITRMLPELGVKADPATANLLYSGILDDSGGFRFSNTTASAHNCAATLLSAGADAEFVSSALYFSVPENVLRLRAYAVRAMELWFDGQVAFVVLCDKDLKRFSATAEDTEGLVDLMRSVKGVFLSILMRETKSNWKLSFRSQTEAIDVESIASEFGGGGHRRAAGASIEGRRDDAIAKVKSRISALFDSLE